MAAFEPGKIRNVVVVGHRGTGKTSLVEAMLFQGGATNRLGTVDAGSTVSDWDDDEKKRQMSLQASLCHRRVAGAQDQPDRHARRRGLPGRRARGAARGRGRDLHDQRRDGRRGRHAAPLEARRRARPRARDLRQHARPRARRLLPGSRRDARAALRALRRRRAADRPRARADGRGRRPAHVRLHEPGGRARGRAAADPRGDGRRRGGVPREAARRGRAERRGVDGALPRGRGALGRGGGRRAQGRGHPRRGLPGRLRRRHEEPRRALACWT